MAETERTSEFDGVAPRSTVDYALRTTQQNQMQLNLMADTKANIMITVSSIVFSIVLSQIHEPNLKLPMATLGLFSLGSLFLAILAVLPRFAYPTTPEGKPDYDSSNFNLLFFGHFSTMDFDEFKLRLGESLKDDSGIYEKLASDIYGLGYFLGTKKYRYVRYSYVCFLTGATITAAEIAGIFVMGWL